MFLFRILSSLTVLASLPMVTAFLVFRIFDSSRYLSRRGTSRSLAVAKDSLMGNLSKLCDGYIMNGSPKIREQVFNVLDEIASESADKELINQSIRMVKRAGVPM